MTENVPPAAATRQAPRGVMWLGLFALLIAAVKFVFGFLGFGIGAALGISTSVFMGEALWGSTGVGIAQMIGAAIWAAVGRGLRGLKSWAWLLSVIAAIVSALSGILSILTGGRAWPALGVGEVVIAVLILFYLFRPQVKRAFRR